MPVKHPSPPPTSAKVLGQRRAAVPAPYGVRATRNLVWEPSRPDGV